MRWKSIRLELAQTGEFPSGSVSRAYLMRLPLDDRDRIDSAAVERHPDRATFRRHWSSEPDERGPIVRQGSDWRLQCNGSSRTLMMDSQPIRLGESFTVVDHDGHALPFRVASVR